MSITSAIRQVQTSPQDTVTPNEFEVVLSEMGRIFSPQNNANIDYQSLLGELSEARFSNINDFNDFRNRFQARVAEYILQRIQGAMESRAHRNSFFDLCCQFQQSFSGIVRCDQTYLTDAHAQPSEATLNFLRRVLPGFIISPSGIDLPNTTTQILNPSRMAQWQFHVGWAYMSRVLATVYARAAQPLYFSHDRFNYALRMDSYANFERQGPLGFSFNLLLQGGDTVHDFRYSGVRTPDYIRNQSFAHRFSAGLGYERLHYGETWQSYLRVGFNYMPTFLARPIQHALELGVFMSLPVEEWRAPFLQVMGGYNFRASYYSFAIRGGLFIDPSQGVYPVVGLSFALVSDPIVQGIAPR